MLTDAKQSARRWYLELDDVNVSLGPVSIVIKDLRKVSQFGLHQKAAEMSQVRTHREEIIQVVSLEPRCVFF